MLDGEVLLMIVARGRNESTLAETVVKGPRDL